MAWVALLDRHSADMSTQAIMSKSIFADLIQFCPAVTDPRVSEIRLYLAEH